MRKPTDSEKLLCPIRGITYEPTAVWDSKLGTKKITYGIFPPHSHTHDGEECDYSGHVAAVNKVGAADVALVGFVI